MKPKRLRRISDIKNQEIKSLAQKKLLERDLYCYVRNISFEDVYLEVYFSKELYSKKNSDNKFKTYISLDETISLESKSKEFASLKKCFSDFKAYREENGFYSDDLIALFSNNYGEIDSLEGIYKQLDISSDIEEDFFYYTPNNQPFIGLEDLYIDMHDLLKKSEIFRFRGESTVIVYGHDVSLTENASCLLTILYQRFLENKPPIKSFDLQSQAFNLRERKRRIIDKETKTAKTTIKNRMKTDIRHFFNKTILWKTIIISPRRDFYELQLNFRTDDFNYLIVKKNKQRS